MTELNNHVQPGAESSISSQNEWCGHCAAPREDLAPRCPHCGVPFGMHGVPEYENVLHARVEAPDLDALFASARGQHGHSDEWMAQFDAILERSFTVMCRDLDTVYDLVVRRGRIVRPYLSGVYFYGNPADREVWEERRDHAERGLFKRYGDRINYGNLTLKGRGIGGKFGNCVLDLREVAYVHRASVFIENTAKWYEEAVARYGGFSKVPKGYRAEWSKRAKVAYLKFAEYLRADRPPDPDTIEDLLLPNWPEATNYIEVNILGDVTRHSVKKYLFPAGYEGQYLFDRTIEALATLGIETGGCAWTR